jgi:DNA replication protein DnaC
MIRKASEVLSESIYTREKFVQMFKAQIERLKEIGAPDWDIQDIERQMNGGNCIECGIEYEKVGVKNPIADYYYYKPGCDCAQSKRSEDERRQARERLLLSAGVPKKYWSVTFSSWDYSVDERTTAAMRQVLEKHESGELWERSGLFLYGEVGTGKTHVGVCVIKKIMARKRVLFIPTADIISRFLKDDEAEEIKTADAIMLDDFDKLASQNEWVKERIFSLIDGFIRDEKFFVITANYGDVAEFDDKVGMAVSSRIFGNCVTVKLPGKDYRMTKKAREESGEEKN